MIAITVSTNYDDILDIIIPQNYKFFEKWYIITDKNDTNTINVINKHNCSNIFILFYNFHENNKCFNKGGAIRYCQREIIGNLGYNGDVLILDSDIWLPDNFIEIVNDTSIHDDTIYGSNTRHDFHSYENFKNNVVDFDYTGKLHGFFQLYKYDKNKLYNESNNCSECDLFFLNRFSKKVILSNLNVCHLGKNGVNWDKRIDKTDFIIHQDV